MLIRHRIVLISLLMPIILLFESAAAVAAPEIAHPPEPANHAEAAALIDVASGRILYEKQGDQQMRIASLTKIMTAIVAIEHGSLKGEVTVSRKAFAKEGSSLFLKLGEQMKLEDMLYGLMLRSGNDAATAIAEHVGGSEEGFVFLMNAKAEELGLNHTHFANPHGLDEEDHYSTANDLAKLTAYALQNPVFREIVKTEAKKAPNPNEQWDYSWQNKNKMLRLYEGADGVKTGYTKKAFRCLVSSATRDGRQLAAVTLNDGDDWNDHSRMLDYGFRYYPVVEITQKNTLLNGYNFVTGASFSYPLAKGEERLVSKKLVLMSTEAGSSRSDRASFGLRGRIDMLLDGNLIGTVPVYEKGSYIPPGKQASSPPASAGIQESSWRNAWSEVMHRLFSA
ncbi:D-alanyl-D-alanine carboxypeptidase [Paenibacillus sp. P96]|uniref:D-alanyl-D-alanine carboxypeptidase n=1 Tax=Paenibacillus zeirhizosphaerae TaxID=2987519 RepID=A0ABT9FPM4_9BACL|nr:D-alanyl-D-alanine carboxypeptidase family protein [Paenibacillus sp. P96]MDP4096685.1 D-alanyl-D-alanine carboxypeptidase [Paenibacillus sp. P96]